MAAKTSPLLLAAASPAFLAKECVNVIELDRLKEEAGARWPRISEGVGSRLEALLRAKLGPNDFFMPLGDSAYLVTMPGTPPEDVSTICTRVAFDLYHSFLGRCNLDSIHVDVVLSGEDDTLVLNRLPREKIVELAEKSGIPLAEIRRSLDPEIPRQAETSALGFTPVTAGVRGNGLATVPMEPPPPIAQFHFIPIWSVPNAALTAYACEPKTIFVTGRPHAVPLAQLTTKERMQVDLMVLRHGLTCLENAWANGKRSILVALASFDTIGTPAGRIEWVAACRELSNSYRPYLTFVIYDVPPGVAQSRLANMVTVLKPFCRGVLATISPEERTYGAYQGIGLKGLGYDLRQFAGSTVFRQHDVERLAQFARQNNLVTFLWDVRDKNVLKFAQDASVHNLSGPAVAKACETPQGMLRLSWAEVLARPETELWV